MRLLALVWLLAGCTFDTPDRVLGECTWTEAPAITEAGPIDWPACLHVSVSSDERVSAEPLPPCEAAEVGQLEVTVPHGRPVFRYYQPSRAAFDREGEAVSKWVNCPAEPAPEPAPRG